MKAREARNQIIEKQGKEELDAAYREIRRAVEDGKNRTFVEATSSLLQVYIAKQLTSDGYEVICAKLNSKEPIRSYSIGVWWGSTRIFT